jgi:hypothetical protein
MSVDPTDASMAVSAVPRGVTAATVTGSAARNSTATGATAPTSSPSEWSDAWRHLEGDDDRLRIVSPKQFTGVFERT